MPSETPFSWTVRFTVAPVWVQDGFTIDDERALKMLARTLSSANIGMELDAVVLHAPSPLQISRTQGYHAQHPGAGKVVRDLVAGIPENNKLYNALIAARKLLDSVAFVAKEGDTVPILAKIDAALAAIDARQGERFEIEV